MIRDYPCIYLEKGAEEALTKTALPIPEVYLYGEQMAELAMEIRAQKGSSWCVLPFCHTVEAEAMGALVNYGDRKNGPRVREYACRSLEELLALRDIDFEKGRIKEVLSACKSLTGRGKVVLLEITGPFTILNGLIDPAILFRLLRKESQAMVQVFEKLADNILQYIHAAETCGVQVISYADPTGGVSIIGPKLAKQITETFTLPLLRKADVMLKPETLIHLCPKTVFALLDSGCANEENFVVPFGLNYAEACLYGRGKVRFIGKTCVKNSRLQSGENLQHLLLKTEE